MTMEMTEQSSALHPNLAIIVEHYNNKDTKDIWIKSAIKADIPVQNIETIIKDAKKSEVNILTFARLITGSKDEAGILMYRDPEDEELHDSVLSGLISLEDVGEILMPILNIFCNHPRYLWKMLCHVNYELDMTSAAALALQNLEFLTELLNKLSDYQRKVVVLGWDSENEFRGVMSFLSEYKKDVWQNIKNNFEDDLRKIAQINKAENRFKNLYGFKDADEENIYFDQAMLVDILLNDYNKHQDIWESSANLAGFPVQDIEEIIKSESIEDISKLVTGGRNADPAKATVKNSSHPDVLKAINALLEIDNDQDVGDNFSATTDGAHESDADSVKLSGDEVDLSEEFTDL